MKTFNKTDFVLWQIEDTIFFLTTEYCFGQENAKYEYRNAKMSAKLIIFLTLIKFPQAN